MKDVSYRPQEQRKKYTMNRPILIALEGLDGSGKTALAGFLIEWFTLKKIPAMLTHEPTYISEHSKRIKRVLIGEEKLEPLEMQKLYIEDRRWHLKETIEPALADGNTVITDRYWLSTIAYGILAGLTDELIELHNDILKPDITIIYDTDPAECLRRIAIRGETPELFDKIEKMEKIRAAYLELAQTMPATYVVDNNRPLAAAQKETLEIIEQKLASVMV